MLKFLNQWLHSPMRITAVFIASGAVVLYQVARAYYRPYVYSHGIYDFHVADTLGNSLGTMATVFVFASLFGTDFRRGVSALRAGTVCIIIYELLHPLLGKPIDPWDLIATLITGAASELIFRALFHRPPMNA